MIRIHEFNGNDNFRDKVFTIEEYRDWYAGSKNGNKSDFEKDLYGFSIYGSGLRGFVKKYPKSKLTDKEDRFISKVREVMRQGNLRLNSKFVIVACFNGEFSINFRHETAHAFYYLNKEYQNGVRKLVKTLDPSLRAKIKKHLNTLDYSDDEMDDEIYARLCSENTIKGAFDGNVSASDKIMPKFSEHYSLFAKEHLHGDFKNV